MTRSTTPFSDVGTSEIVKRTFDFAAQLAVGEALTGDPSVTITTEIGEDDDAQNRLLSEPMTIGTQVTFLVGNLLDGVVYRILVASTTTQEQTISLWQYQVCAGP